VQSAFVVLAGLAAIASALAFSSAVVPSATVEAVAPSEVSLQQLSETELKDADPTVIRVLQLADQFVAQGVKYRRLKALRRLSRSDLSVPPRRLSCSEFVWYLFSVAGLDMGEHPISSKRLAFRDNVYPLAFTKVTDGTVRPGDVLVYANSADELARQKQTLGVSQVGHVVIMVSAKEQIVVGSHGRESTPEGARRGAGYRRLLDGREHWSQGRVLRATYRIKPDAALVNPGRR